MKVTRLSEAESAQYRRAAQVNAGGNDWRERERQEFAESRRRAQGYPKDTFVSAGPAPLATRPQAQGELIPSPAMAIMTSGAAGGHARSDDDAVKHAQATLLVAAGYAVAGLMITIGLLLVAWWFRWLGGRWPAYVYGGVLLWGVVIVVALIINRWQGLRHSPTGVAHHEIDARTETAFYAIDTHAELLRERWAIDAGADAIKILESHRERRR